MRPDRPSRTAQHNALFRALESRRPPSERIVDDALASHLLPWSFRVLTELARLPLVRSAIERYIDKRWPGPRSGVVVRTRLIDEAIKAELPDLDQVLILGAGLDTRAYRMAAMAQVSVYEVDHPSTQAWKHASLLRSVGTIPNHVRLVPVDLGREDPGHALAGAGFKTGIRTLVLWEGVTNYLSAEDVDGTFVFISSVVGAGSPILFTYVDRAIIDDPHTFEGAEASSKHVRRVSEPYTFGFDPQEVTTYLAERDITVLRDTPVSEAVAHYYPVGKAPRGYAYYHVVAARRN